MARRVMVDFDGVLHSYRSGWLGAQTLEEPEPGALAFVRELIRSGFEVVVFTTRASTAEGWEATMAWLADNRFPEMLVTDKKLPAIAYIDDRAIPYVRPTSAGDGFGFVLARLMEVTHG